MPDSVAPRDPPPKRPALELPLGARSCGGHGRNRGGLWEACDATNLPAERAVIEVMSRSKDDAKLLRREMLTSMRLAEQGRLTYGKEADVYACSSADLVLEMRFDHRVQYPDGVRAVRLYFSEPDNMPGVLLSAKLGAKPATPQGLDLQDEHMADAQARVEKHLGL
jgi:hypothetical protein